MSNKRTLIVGLALVVAVGGTYMLLGGESQAQQQQNGGGAGMGMPVEAAPVKVERINRVITAVGSLQSDESVILSPEIAGRVLKINFDEGQTVKAGDLLIQLDDAVYAAELDEARANLSLSRTNHQRAAELFRKGAGTERSRDEAFSRMKVDEARVGLAKARVEKMALRAPFDGVVGLRSVSVGDYVNVGQALANLEKMDVIKVDFRLAELNLPLVNVGQKLQVRVDAYPDRVFDGEVYAIDPRIGADGRSIVVRARIANTTGELRPGLFARVQLVVDSREDAIIVPEQALMPQGEAHNVYVVDADSKVEMRTVKVGIRRKGEAEIVEGLKAGDVVISGGQIKVGPGMPVMVLPSGAAKAAAPAAEQTPAEQEAAPAETPAPAADAADADTSETE